MRQLTDGASLLSFHVDALELSCAVDQVPMLYGGDCDELDAKLSGLKGRARTTHPWHPVPSGWTWDETADQEPVVALPTALRDGYQFVLQCEAWVLFVAAPRAVVPRFAMQLRADYLLRTGPLLAYGAARAWVERYPMTLVQGIAPGTEPQWRISRLDLAADIAGVQLAATDLDHFTTRARIRETHHHGHGWDWAVAT